MTSNHPGTSSLSTKWNTTCEELKTAFNQWNQQISSFIPSSHPHHKKIAELKLKIEEVKSLMTELNFLPSTTMTEDTNTSSKKNTP